jgi:hypothetical protein
MCRFFGREVVVGVEVDVKPPLMKRIKGVGLMSTIGV